jgi:hypothetical protein
MQNGKKPDEEKSWPSNIGSGSPPKRLDSFENDLEFGPWTWLYAGVVALLRFCGRRYRNHATLTERQP